MEPTEGIDPSDHQRINRANWDSRVPHHLKGYEVDRLRGDPSALSRVVEFDLPRLGVVAGLRGVHLQCHIGTDTVSLARLGARMTGLDFSTASIEQARLLAQACGADVAFVVSDVEDALSVLPGHAFDLVYTGIGALCWLPSIERWATVVAGLLAPGGRLFLREGHPMMWAIDESDASGALVVGYPYFETAEPIVFDEPGTYVTTDEELLHTVSHSWNHGIGEIVSALVDQGLTITGLVEHRSVPWNALGDERMTLGPDGEWRLVDHPERLPLSYTLQAQRPD